MRAGRVGDIDLAGDKCAIGVDGDGGDAATGYLDSGRFGILAVGLLDLLVGGSLSSGGFAEV